VSLRRGEVVWVRLSPGEGAEQNKMRPAIVVSNNAANASAQRAGRGVVTIVPLTSARIIPLPHQVAAPTDYAGLDKDGVVQTEQIRAVDISRVSQTGRIVAPELMRALERSLAVHLDLP
jgi:mRNA interferase MazF